MNRSSYSALSSGVTGPSRTSLRASLCLFECLFQRGLSRYLKNRILVFAKLHLVAASFGQVHGIIQGLLKPGKIALHLLTGLEIELIIGKLQPVGIIHAFSRLDTQEDIVSFSIILIQIVTVVGGNKG